MRSVRTVGEGEISTEVTSALESREGTEPSSTPVTETRMSEKYKISNWRGSSSSVTGNKKVKQCVAQELLKD